MLVGARALPLVKGMPGVTASLAALLPRHSGGYLTPHSATLCALPPALVPGSAVYIPDTTECRRDTLLHTVNSVQLAILH